MKKSLVFYTLFLVIGSSYGMGKNHSGTMSLSANARSICNGPRPLESILCAWGWNDVTSNHGLFNASSLRDPQVTGAIVGGMIGSAIRATITDASLDKTSPLIRPIVNVAAKHPFLVAYTGLHAWYRWNEIKSNPWPFIGETSLIALHLYNESNY